MIEIFIPLVTVSESNVSEHWTKKHLRHRRQKKITFLYLLEHRHKLSIPCHVKLSRLSPRFLDKEDNLPSALKWVKDAVAEFLIPGLKAGRADDDKRITWEFDQVKVKAKERGIKVQIFIEKNKE